MRITTGRRTLLLRTCTRCCVTYPGTDFYMNTRGYRRQVCRFCDAIESNRLKNMQYKESLQHQRAPYRYWTREELQQMVAMIRHGVMTPEIAEALGRSTHSIYSARLRLKKPEGYLGVKL